MLLRHGLLVIGRNGINGHIALPEESHDPPTSAIVQQLNAVDAARQRLGIVGRVARLVGAPDVGDGAAGFGAVRHLVFVETVFEKIGKNLCDVVVGREEASLVLPLRVAVHDNEARAGEEE